MDSIRVSEALDPRSIRGEATKPERLKVIFKRSGFSFFTQSISNGKKPLQLPVFYTIAVAPANWNRYAIYLNGFGGVGFNFTY
ncbi:MAG: hypothetical protein JWR72_3202 [Flavisolibacter sp.]|jgi:hypothetical protein|nr:hypothetical protein [Flavisolibacter sp.]